MKIKVVVHESKHQAADSLGPKIKKDREEP
jgi:hypothetical protein